MQQAGNSSPMDWAWLGLALFALFVGIVAWYYLEENGMGLTFNEHKTTFSRTAIFTSIGLLAVYTLGQPQVSERFGEKSAAFIASLQADRMSIKDDQMQERGYYEQLLDSRVQMSALWESNNRRPSDWQGMVPAGVARETDDLLYEELFPSIKTVFKRAPLTTNQWRMRDQEYTLAKPEHTLRMAMFGKSYEMGWGVKNEQVFEQIAEDRLNETASLQTGLQYEMLNFSVGGYTTIQYTVIAEEKLVPFDPDVVFITTHAGEGSRAVANLLKIYGKGIALPADLQHLITAAGLHSDMPYSEQKRLLDAYQDDLVRLGYERVLKVCEENDILPVWLFVPRTIGHVADLEGQVENVTEFEHWSAIGRDTGFEHLWSLVGAFDGFENVSKIQLAEWDTHPNVKGHKLLGDRFYDVLMQHQEDLARLVVQD
jgi:hypothetical protein